MSEHRGALTRRRRTVSVAARARSITSTSIRPSPGARVELGAGLRWARIPLPMELNHINVWLLRHEDGWMLVDTGLARRRLPRGVAQPRAAATSAGVRCAASSSRTTIRTTWGSSRWLHERHGAPVWMSAIAHRSTGDYLAAAPDALRERQHAFVHRARHGHRARGAAQAVRQRARRRGSAGCRRSARAAAGGDRLARRRARLGPHRDQRPLPRAPVPVRRAQRGADQRRPGPADDLAERERARRRARTRTRCASSSTRWRGSSSARRKRWCCRRTAGRSAACTVASTCCGRTISNSWTSLREACREPAGGVRPAAGHVRAPAAWLSPVPGAGRNGRAPELPLARR